MSRVTSNSVSAFVFRREGASVRFLLLRRTPAGGGFWQSVSGLIEPGETASQAARREVLEETGLDPLRLFPLESINSYYVEKLDFVILEPCFGVEVGSSEVRRSDEHDLHEWLDFPAARVRLHWPGNRRSLQELARLLGPEELREGRSEEADEAASEEHLDWSV